MIGDGFSFLSFAVITITELDSQFIRLEVLPAEDIVEIISLVLQ